MSQKHNGTVKLQSALEYLSNYSWAIIIIAVVLGVIFNLGLLNSVTYTPKAQPGSCALVRPGGPGTTAGAFYSGSCNDELPEYSAFFSGPINSVVTVNNPSYLSPNAETLCVWFAVNSSAGSGRMASKATSGGTSIMDIYDNGGYLGARATNTALTSSFIQPSLSSNAPPTLTFEFGCSSYNAGNITVYYNGAELATGTPLTGTLARASTPFYIGYATQTGTYYSGFISNVQFYNASLSPNSIYALYVEGIGGQPIRTQNLVGWWPLNGNANDTSGDGNNGQAANVFYRTTWTNYYKAP